MRSEAEAVTRQTPMMVDKSTRLDTAGYDHRVFFYHFTQTDHASTEYSPAQREKYANLMRAQVINKACSGSAIRAFLDAGVTFKYVHFANDHRQLSEVLVTRDSCSQSQGVTSKASSRSREPQRRVAARSSVVTISRGENYDAVMEKLRGFEGKKQVLGSGSLRAEYGDPALVAYPDTGDVCVLSFHDGKLTYCQGCKPGRFNCSLGSW